LYALVATGGRAVVRPLGTAAPAIEAHERLRHDLDALAIDGLPAPLRRSVRASARTALRRLDSLVWQPVRDAVSDGPVLLAPSAALATVPWPLLPALRGRPVTVVASVSAWLAARSAADRVRLPASPAVTLAAGPSVARAGAEIAAVATVWESGIVHCGHRAADVRRPLPRPICCTSRRTGGTSRTTRCCRTSTWPTARCSVTNWSGWPDAAAHRALGVRIWLVHSGPATRRWACRQRCCTPVRAAWWPASSRVGDAAAHRVAVAHHVGLRAGRPPAEAARRRAGRRRPGGRPPALVCFGAAGEPRQRGRSSVLRHGGSSAQNAASNGGRIAAPSVAAIQASFTLASAT
jgi:hypothetical protein